MNSTHVIERDELTTGEARIAKYLLGGRGDWNPDVALRYLPLVRIIRDHELVDQITEIGSGSMGVAPYVRLPVVALDSTFSPPIHPMLSPIVGSVLTIPFKSSSLPCVISVDMLEHLPPALRLPALTELVRVTRNLLIVAVPCGQEAEEHDQKMAARFRRKRNADFAYLIEHLENGLPTVAELSSMIETSIRESERPGQVSLIPNANLKLREFIVKRWIDRGIVDKMLWVVMIWMSSLLARSNFGTTYRQVAVVVFED